MTKEQKALAEKHGTLDEFTDAVINAIGEISIREALEGIARYRAEWYAAGSAESER